MHWSSPSLFDAHDPIAEHVGLVLRRLSSGGSERIAVRLANEWVQRGRRVTLFCGDADGPLAPLISPSINVVAIAQHGPRSRAEFGAAIADPVRRHAPDVVVGPGNYHVPILSALQRRLGGDRPAIVSKISNPLRRADRSRLGQALFAMRFRRQTCRFEALVAMSPVFAAEAAFVTERADIACVDEPNLDAMPQARAPRSAGGGAILCIGRLSPQKNFSLALDTFARLPSTFRLVMLGEGEEQSALQARAAALGIADRVRFMGFVGDVRPYLDEADALLCTSRYEGYPAVLIEALAANVPIVSTPCTLALPEILTDDSFGIVADADPADLAAALEAVIGQRLRPAAAPLAELARRHQIGRSTDAWLAVLDRAVARRDRARGTVRRLDLLQRPPAG